MKKEELVEDNKLIASYMGYTYFGHNDLKLIFTNNGKEYKHPAGWKTTADTSYLSKENALKSIRGIKHHYLCRGHNYLQYHSSWDWLMPVVHKCCKEIYTNSKKNEYIYPILMDMKLNSTIEGV